MEFAWHEDKPIYRQLRDRVAAMMLDGGVAEGEALPSVRSLAAECRVNPLTVLKAYQALVDEGLVEKRRGLGMFMTTGARTLLLDAERQRFLKEIWPGILETLRRLELSPESLIAAARAGREG